MAHLPTLQGFQRRYLRSQAHGLEPVVQIGSGGLSASIILAVDTALADHELIKVRLHEPEDKKGMAQTLADQTQAILCGVVGHTVILYRPHPETPKIVLPQRAG